MAGGAMAGGGGNGAQSISQLQQVLEKLGGGQGASPQGGANPFANMAGLGASMMRPGMQAPTPPPQMAPRPMVGMGGPGVPVQQGAMPNMTAGQGMPIGLMNMALARQNGMI